jgi:hypothetical protein
MPPSAPCTAEHAGSHERRAIKFAHGAEGLAGLRREVALWGVGSPRPRHSRRGCAPYRQDGNLSRAEALLRDAVERARRVFTHGEYYLGQYESELAEVLLQESKRAEAKK